MRRRQGFTLIELLAVIGIIAILISILLPVLWRARGAAMKVVCSSRLRDLTMAATMYQGEYRGLPGPMLKNTGSSGMPTFRPAPQRISGELLNQLRPYLAFPEIMATTPASALPAFVQCPFIEAAEDNRGPFPTGVPDRSTYYTGYAYLGRLSEASIAAHPSATSSSSSLLPIVITLPSLPVVSGALSALEPGVELKPGRAAPMRPAKRTVLWADNVSQSDDTASIWQYTHARRASRGSAAVTYTSPSELLGQHRAYTDGSVEWVKNGGDELNVTGSNASNLNAASFKTFAGELWWF